MHNLAQKFLDNKLRIEKSIAKFSGLILPVTKSLDPQDMRILRDCGVRDVGENRVQSIMEKESLCQNTFRWHMIGRLQKNKVKTVVRLCSMIHSIHSFELIECVQKEAQKQGKIMSVLLQVNVSGEASKQGVSPDELSSVCEKSRALSHISLEGLMTMAPFTEDINKIRKTFSSLRNWSNLLELKECSMGMSHDYSIAASEGATILRLGRVLFS